MDLGEWRAAIARDPLAVVGLDSDGLLYPQTKVGFERVYVFI